MQRLTTLTGSLLLLAFIVTPALADDKDKKGWGGKPGAMAREGIDTFLTGCEEELTTFCSQVSPGEGRLLACLYAHEDKISPTCEHALLDAAFKLDRAVSMLLYFATACDQDLTTYCADVQPGEGRLVDCLSKQEEKLDKQCAKALEELK